MPLDQTMTRFGCVGFSMFACGFSVPPNAAILLVCITAKIKMSFIWKDDFFFAKIGIFCKSITGPLSKAKRHWVRRLFNVCVQVFCAPNATILFVYIPAKIEMSFIWKDDFFCAKIGIFCKSITGPLSEAKTQPSYSFSGRIKLIICQIRHELSVTIHEISSSWKKVRWRTLYITNTSC